MEVMKYNLLFQIADATLLKAGYTNELASAPGKALYSFLYK